ncbi:hypothetical protein [Spiroplasma floricola]|uniref:Uncharacterized protein n=1 Tax=Spiroplasma floricola 23-6 TaxID=1336749 RepID=A0A2K8SE20_9MOLU|nr:hypothetical protein [Spiroplasma floricola]AUB31673.1 hypothetical protein SFLOR_v1c06230 [Spiroplasma floricola 23-6]
MNKKTEKLKQGIFKVAVSSMILFIISLVLTSIFVTLLVIHTLKIQMSWLWLGLAVVTGVIAIFALFSMIGGFIFLKANKNWKELQKVQKKSALDWGLFYFVFSSKIDKLSDIEHKKQIENNEL